MIFPTFPGYLETRKIQYFQDTRKLREIKISNTSRISEIQKIKFPNMSRIPNKCLTVVVLFKITLTSNESNLLKSQLRFGCTGRIFILRGQKKSQDKGQEKILFEKNTPMKFMHFLENCVFIKKLDFDRLTHQI